MITITCSKCHTIKRIPVSLESTVPGALEWARQEGWMNEFDRDGKLCPACAFDWLLYIVHHGYALSFNGVHGLKHWSRVEANGMRLIKYTGANHLIVHYFAYLHDSKRENDGTDKEHGFRASEWIRKDIGKWLPLKPDELEILCAACAIHSQDLKPTNPTIATCLDADRLDLPRPGVNVVIDRKELCTLAARNKRIINWATKRAQLNLNE